MIGPQEQLKGFLIIIELTKIYKFWLCKFVYFEKFALDEFFVRITRNAHYH